MDSMLLKELKVPDDPMFPVRVHNASCDNSSNIFVCHWHDEMELLLITEGKAMIQVNTTYHELTAGQAVFINHGEVHACYAIDDRDYSFCAVVFDSNLLYGGIYDTVELKYMEPLLKNQQISHIHIQGLHNWEIEALKHITEINRLYLEKPFSFEMAVKAHLYLIFHGILSNDGILVKKSPSPSNKAGQLKEILNYIKDHYDEKIYIRSLASLVDFSEGHFCGFFRQMTGMTPIEYVNYFRVNKAAEMIRSTERKIIEIAMDVGFDNFSYFINRFKFYFKRTPLEYRKLNL